MDSPSTEQDPPLLQESRNQDVFFHTLERQFGSTRRILIALLEVMHRRRSRRAPGPLVKWLAKEVNLACRYRELDILPIGDLIAFIESLAALEGKPTAAESSPASR